MSTPVEIVVIVAAVGYVLARRMMGEPAEAKRMLILPAVLGVIGLSNVSDVVSTPLSVVFLVATVAISVVLGVLRGASVRISRRDGFAFVRYTAVTLALWAANVAVKVAASVLLGIIDSQDNGVTGDGILLTIGAGLLAEGLVVCLRALRSDHRVMWSKSKNDIAHESSPMLDNLGRNLAGRDDDPARGSAAAATWKTRHDDHR